MIVDGPITSRAHIPGAAGVIKTHATAYLPPELHRLVGTLSEAARSPVFTIGGRGAAPLLVSQTPGREPGTMVRDRPLRMLRRHGRPRRRSRSQIG